MSKSFKTTKQKLIVKPLSQSDSAQYFKLVQTNRKHLSQFHIMGEARFKTHQDVLNSITKPLNSKKTRYGVWKNETLVGFVSLVNKGHKRCEVGMWIGQDFTRRGYATDAIQSIARHALNKLGYVRVIATVDPRNEASQNTLLKSGFRLVRRFRKRYYFAFVD